MPSSSCRAALGSMLGVAVLALASPAGAFCRTTTVAVPPGYDPTQSGCITQGTAIAWPSLPVTYELHRSASSQISLSDATPIFEAAFASWSQVSCPGSGKHPALSFDTLAPIDAPFDACGEDAQACETAEAHGPHQIIFRDDAWPYDDPFNTIALTTVTFGLETGHILSANMEINSHQWSLSPDDPAPAGEIALPAIARHEAGHFIGLAHSQESTAAMYAFYSPDMMSLTADDIDGICTIYPPASGCSCSMERSEGGALTLGAAGVALAAVAARRRRRAA